MRAEVIENADGKTLRRFVRETVEDGATVYTDDATAYKSLPRRETVRHSVGEYFNGMVHTNGLASFWSLVKRGYHYTYHHMNPKHLHRYVAEFSERHNVRCMDTKDQMAWMMRNGKDKELRYKRPDRLTPSVRKPASVASYPPEPQKGGTGLPTNLVCQGDLPVAMVVGGIIGTLTGKRHGFKASNSML